MTTAVYRVEHETRYVHSGRVSTSQHVACLTPRTLPTADRAVARAGGRAGAGQSCPAGRLLRQRRRPVHDSDALQGDARGRPERRRGMRNAPSATVMARLDAGGGAAPRARRRGRSAVREQRTLGSGARRAHLRARVAVRRNGGVQLSLPVHRHEPRTGGVCPRVVCEGSSAGRGGRRPDAPDQPGIRLRFRSHDDRDPGDAGA